MTILSSEAASVDVEFSGFYDSIKRNVPKLQAEMASALRVDARSLHMSMLRQAQVFGIWGAALALGERDYRLQKAEIDEVILPKARLLAEQSILDSGRKVTVQAKADVARADPTYCIARTGLIEQQMLNSVLKTTTVALIQKMNMMQSLNSRQKAELTAIPVDSWDVPAPVTPTEYDPANPPREMIRKTASGEAELSAELKFLKERYRAQKRVTEK